MQIYSFDDLLAEKGLRPDEVNFVRMDVEGHEVEVICGMATFLSEAQRLGVLMEIHPEMIEENHGPHAHDDMLTVLESSGMKIGKVTVGTTCRTSELQGGLAYADLRNMEDVYSVLFTTGI